LQRVDNTHHANQTQAAAIASDIKPFTRFALRRASCSLCGGLTQSKVTAAATPQKR
jgi:hypothetical protein